MDLIKHYIIFSFAIVILISACGGGGGNNDSGSSHPEFLTPVAGKLFFIASEENDRKDKALWVTDGTEAGTLKLKDKIIYPGVSHIVSQLESIGNTVFFSAFDEAEAKRLWKTDGTKSGTSSLTDKTILPQSIITTNSRVFFLTQDSNNSLELWYSDGTDTGSSLVKSIDPNDQFNSLASIGDTLFFAIVDKSFTLNGRMELWKTNGTVTGTVMIANLIRPGHGGLNFSKAINNNLYFTASDGNNNSNALWVSNGTTLDTFILKDDFINRWGDTTSIGIPQTIVELNGDTFFLYQDVLWKTDGTSTSTLEVKNLFNEGFADSENLVATNDLLYFTTGYGDVLWKSDGTESGTVKMGEINQTIPSNFNFYALVAVNDLLFFKRDNGYKFNLWITNGTDNGTKLVKSMIATWGGDEDISSSDSTAASDTKLYFTASEGGYYKGSGEELWISDGTTKGTHIVKDINQSPAPTED